MKIFEESIRSKETLHYYKVYLEKFLQFTNTSDYGSLIKLEPKKLEFLLIEYVSHLKKFVEMGEISPNGFPQRFAPIETFLVQNDVLLNFKKIKRMFPRRVKTRGESPYTRKDLQDFIEFAPDQRARAIVSFFVSTGARPQSIEGLQLRNLKEMDLGCKGVLIYENDQEEYWAFLTPEATKYLDEYFKDREFHGEKLKPESPVFRSDYGQTAAWLNVRPLNKKALYGVVYRMLCNSKIRERNTVRYKRHGKAIFGGFRKWYETTLDSIDGINPSIVEKLMGHKNDLRGTYFNPEIQKRFETFQKAIPDLTINDTDRKELELIKKTSSQSVEIKKIVDEAVLAQLNEAVDKKLAVIKAQGLEERVRELEEKLNHSKVTNEKSMISENRN